jgi:hypothetical protein
MVAYLMPAMDPPEHQPEADTIAGESALLRPILRRRLMRWSWRRSQKSGLTWE